jgi:hypothetical protein
MSKELNMDAVIAWLYVMEAWDTCFESHMDGAYVRLIYDLINSYPDEWDAVLAVRDANRLMGVKHE